MPKCPNRKASGGCDQPNRNCGFPDCEKPAAKAVRPYTIEYHRSHRALWYWRMRAPNGKIVADGSEGYYAKSTIKRALRRLCEATGFNGPVIEVDFIL